AFVGDGDIWVAAVDGTGVDNLTDGTVEQPRQPAWRPDRDHVLLASDEGLRLLDLTAGLPAAVVTDDPDHADPAWDPLGERIVYSIPGATGGRDLEIIPATGGDPDLIEVAQPEGQDGPVNAFRPAWSPDGLQIAYQGEH